MSETPTDYTGPERILSGMQPTGALHLGNYLGALKNWVALQDRGVPCFYCVVDMHAMTMPHDPAALPDAVRSVAAAYLAAGVDPSRSAVFAQSSVREHAELAWIFNCVARLGWLERMTQFKDKAGKDAERASVGLFTYPVLQAADILVYKATHVPVGEDQKQHLELSRDIAARFNRDFGKGEAAKQGPNLYHIVGAPKAHMEGFAYSDILLQQQAEGQTWTYGNLDAFLANPRDYAPGTKMAFAGVRSPEERADILAYLQTLAADPVPFPEPEAAPAEEAAPAGGEVTEVETIPEEIVAPEDASVETVTTEPGAAVETPTATQSDSRVEGTPVQETSPASPEAPAASQ